MGCFPDVIEPVEGWGWVIHWDCGVSENTVLDPCEAMRTHLCPDIGREAESSSPLRLVRPSGTQDRVKASESAGHDAGALTGYPPCSEDAFSDECGGQVKEGLTDSLIPAAIDRGCNPGVTSRTYRLNRRVAK